MTAPKQAGNYDDVGTDCPPLLRQLTIDALVAADQVFIMTESELYSGPRFRQTSGHRDGELPRYAEALERLGQ